MLNSHLKMLKQQHFLYQRKNLYDLMPSRSFLGDPTSDDNSRFHPCWSSFLFSSHRTLYPVVWRWGGELCLDRTWKTSCFDTFLSAAARPGVWYPP